VKAPEFSYSRGIARVDWAEPAVGFTFDLLRLERRTGELSAELTVKAPVNGNGTLGLLHRARVTLGSTRSRTELTNHLQRRQDGPDWPGLLEVASWKVIEAYRQGAPAFLLRDAIEPAVTGWALKPVLIARDPVILFGDGGSLKSYTALAFAVSLQSGVALAGGLEPARPFRVAYCDFEWSDWPHKRRLRALCGPGELPDILYVPCQAAGPLSHQVERLQAAFEMHRIDYAVIDSVGLACDGAPEESASALGFFQALARLEVGSILIAHTNRDAATDKPFGSAYWHNSSRATWNIRRVRAAGSTGVDVGLYQKKVNDGALREDPIGLHFEFADGSTSITQAELKATTTADATTTAARMANLLARGSLADDEIANQLDVSSSTVRSALKRHPGRFMRIPDGTIGLVLR
jgi:DNA-binding CsgD family transcriptional regulator